MAGSFCSPFLLWFEFSVYLKVVLQEKKKKQPFFREKNPLSDFNLGILCLFGCLLRVHVCKNPIYHNTAYLRLLLTLKSFVIEFFKGPFFKMFFLIDFVLWLFYTCIQQCILVTLVTQYLPSPPRLSTPLFPTSPFPNFMSMGFWSLIH